MHRIRAITFDLDNTFWDVWPAIVRAEQAMYEFLSTYYPRITAKYSIDTMRNERERTAQLEPHMAHDFTYLRIATLKRWAREANYDEAMAESAFDVFYRARNTVTLYADVVPALEQLQRRYKLFTLTNGNADLQLIGLHNFFTATFAARDVGALKPDPLIFRHVLHHAGLAPEEVLHVGDDPIADIKGARDVGMQVAWVNRDGTMWSSSHGPNPPTCSTLNDVLSWLSDS